MKLLVAWMSALGKYVSREFHFTMQDLVNVHGWRQIEPWQLVQDTGSPKARMIELVGAVPQVVLFWESYDLFNAIRPALHDLGCRLALFADDLHMLYGQESGRDAKLQALSDSDIVLASYAYVLHDFFPELRHRRTAIWLPHAASPDFALPFNDSPEISIFLSGWIGPLYPLRMQLAELHNEGRFAIAVHGHPGYREDYNYEADTRVGAGYAEKIHAYKAAFTDALTFRYVVAKYFEIPATGALLLADNAVTEPLRELGFVENVHWVPVTAENLEDRIEYVLDKSNSAKIDEIRRSGQELVLTRHKTSNRADLINHVCTA